MTGGLGGETPRPAGLAAAGAGLQAALLMAALGAAGRVEAPLSDPAKGLLVIGSMLAVAAETYAQRGVDPPAASRGDKLLAAQSGLGLLALLLAALLGRAERPFGLAETAGAMVMAAGIALRCLSIRALGERFVTAARVAPGSAQEVGGIYGWLRHPSESGLLLFGLGAAMTSADAVPLAIWAAVLVPATLLRIRREDRALAAAFGEGHERYVAGVGALLPRPSRVLLRRRRASQLPLRSASKYIDPTRV